MKELRVLLVGRTGHGKSSVGNTLLGRQQFEVSNGSQSCTDKCTFGERDFPQSDIRLVVVDTPGIFDTNIPRLQIMKELLKTVLYTTPGFNIIAFVLSPDRFTPELQQTQQLFFEWFGGNVREYACLIMTHCSSQKDVQRYIQNPHSSLQALIQGCNNTILPFENTGTFELKQKQVKQFLDQTLNIQIRNGEQCFTNLAFYIAKEYAKNRDLDTVTPDSMTILQEGGLGFVQDSMHSLKLIDESYTQGNLNIIFDDETETPGTYVETIYSRNKSSVPLVNVAADFELSSADASSPPQRRRASSRANRVFVHPERDTENDTASTRMAYSRQAGTPISFGQPGSVHQRQGSDYDAIPKTERDARVMQGQCLAPSENVANETDQFSVNRGGVPYIASIHSAGADPTGPGSSQRHSPWQISSSRTSLIGASDDYRDFRNDMRDEENVNKFIKFFRWIKRKLTQCIYSLLGTS